MFRILHKIRAVIMGRKSFAGSGDYWEGRYRSGGTSGGGSYGRLALYKADFINRFITDNNVQTAVEWGCGDGHQASFLRCAHYLGLDISPTAIAMCKVKFANDRDKSFALNEEFSSHERKDMAFSLDVLYHLVEDQIYSVYLNQLFESASRYVIIYSCNFDSEPTANHVRPRNFTTHIDLHFPHWKMIYTEENPYPMTVMNDPETSWSQFFVFKKVD